MCTEVHMNSDCCDIWMHPLCLDFYTSFAFASRFSSMTDYDAGVLSLSFKCTVGNIPMNFSKSKQMLSLLLMPCLFTCLPLSHCLVVKHKGQFYAYNRQLETYLLSSSQSFKLDLNKKLNPKQKTIQTFYIDAERFRKTNKTKYSP